MISKYAAKTLSKIKGKEIAPLLFEVFEKVKSEDDHFGDTIAIGKILCDLKAEDLSPIISAMANYLERRKNYSSVSDGEKMNAINILGMAGGQTAVDALLNALEQTDPMVQLAAIIAIGNIAPSNKTVVEGLLIRLTVGVNVVSEQAARVLAQMDKAVLLKGLFLSLESEWRVVREKAAETIFYYSSDEQTLKILSDMAANDTKESVKVAAGEAVKQFEYKQKYF